jgi:hypothetical protein
MATTENLPVARADHPAPIRPPIGLLISIGAPKPERGPGRPIDHFRFKAGELEQYSDAADKAREVYGEAPKQLADLYFLAATPPEVLEVRLLAFSKTSLRGAGLTNYAGIPDEQLFLASAWSFEDDFMFRPKNEKEVRPELREDWKGEPIYDRLKGADDPRIAKIGIELRATLSVCLPEVMGVGTVAQISSAGRASIQNLYRGVWDHYRAFGSLLGYPFRVTVRPRQKERFDPEKRALVGTTIYELVLDTPFSFNDVLERVRSRQTTLGQGGGADMAALARVTTPALQLPPASDEDVAVRDEPTFERASDAQLNRIAILEQQVGEEAQTFLLGVFGVESAEMLDAASAERFEQGLLRVLEEHAEDAGEGEVIA